MKQQIGFIGLGAMGSGMAANLLAKGWPLTVWAHRNQEAAQKLVGAGARQAATPRALAEGCDIVLLCVTGSPQVEAVVKGPDGLAAAGKPLLIVDCSTSNPSSTIALAAELATQGLTLIDAPLARTPKEAAEGKLDVMVGGAAEAVARARPVLEAFAARIVHTGPTGSGHTMKLLNNFVSMGYSAIYSEALTLGAKAGLTPQVFNSVISGSRMDCGFYQAFFDFVLNRNENDPALCHRQCAEGHDLPRLLRPGRRHRQPGRRRGPQRFCHGGGHGARGKIRAGAVGYRRGVERGVAGWAGG